MATKPVLRKKVEGEKVVITKEEIQKRHIMHSKIKNFDTGDGWSIKIAPPSKLKSGGKK